MCAKVTEVTSGSSLSRGAEASSRHMVTRRRALTLAHLCTTDTVAALFTH